jgi:hypothetical protein
MRSRIQLYSFMPSPQPGSAVLAIKQIAHGLTPGGVGSLVRLPPIPGRRAGIPGCLFAALRTTVSKPGLPRFQFKLLTASHASFNRKCHPNKYDTSRESQVAHLLRKKGEEKSSRPQFKKYCRYNVSLWAGRNPASRIILRNSSSVVQLFTPAARTTFSSSITEPTSFPPNRNPI